MLKVANTYFEVHLFLVHVVSVDDVGDVGKKDDVSDVGVGKEDDVGDTNVGKEGDVKDDNGEDIGEQDGVEPDVEAIGGEEGDGGKGIGLVIHEEKECDDDGGHVSEVSSWIRKVEFIEGEVEV